jgi:DNA polymerase I-like protein with 3'-5' exonuclease and polymerase domains
MENYSPIYQPKGQNTAHEWRDHKTYVSTLLGFNRYFTLEFNVLKAFYTLATNIPEEWKNIHINVVRGDRIQTAAGAFQSALYGACYSLQGQIARAAINTPIQGTGAQITKIVQRHIWDIQPFGYNSWVVQPINIHDEIMNSTHPEYVDRVEQVVKGTINELTTVVPLLEMEWHSGLSSWADKKKHVTPQLLTNS